MVRYAGDAPAYPRWQRGVLLMDEYRKKRLVRREGFAPSRAGCRPAMLLLHHHRFKLAAGVGIAPTSRAFQTRAHLSMPSSEKRCVRRELHPRCLPLGNGFTGRCDTSDSRLTRILKIVGLAGIQPWKHEAGCPAVVSPRPSLPQSCCHFLAGTGSEKSADDHRRHSALGRIAPLMSRCGARQRTAHCEIKR